MPEAPHAVTRGDTGGFRPGRRLFLVVVVLSAVLAVVGSTIAWEAYDRDRSRARDDMIAVARTAATVADRALRHRIALLQTIAAAPPLRRSEIRATRAYLESLPIDAGTFSGGIGLVGADGRLEVAGRSPSSGPIEPGDRLHIRWVLEYGKPYVGATVAGRLTRTLLLPISVPVRDRSGRVSGVLVGTMRPDSSSVLRPLRFLSSDLVVIDRGGTVFDARSGENVPVDNRPLLRRLRSEGTGLRTPTLDLRNRPDRALPFAMTQHGGWVCSRTVRSPTCSEHRPRACGRSSPRSQQPFSMPCSARSWPAAASIAPPASGRTGAGTSDDSSAPSRSSRPPRAPAA